MNSDKHNIINSNSNWYGAIADRDKDEVGLLHSISDDSISNTTVQAIAEEAEVQRLKIEIAQKLKVLNTDLKQANKWITSLQTHIFQCYQRSRHP